MSWWRNEKSRGVLKRWAAARARHSLMATLGIVYATLVAMRPERPPPAPARAFHDPPEPEVLMTPAFKFVPGLLAVAAFGVFILANL